MAWLLMVAALAGCSYRPAPPPLTLDRRDPSPLLPPGPTPLTNAAPLPGPSVRAPFAGAPVLIAGNEDGPSVSNRGQTPDAGGDFLLNFDNADIRDVLKLVLSDMLGLTYTVDPAVQGAVTIHSGRPLGKASVLPVFEQALSLAGVALVANGPGYTVLPSQAAAQRGLISGPSPGSLQAGYQIAVLPLRSVPAGDMQRVLEPLTTPGTVLRADPATNTITVAGTEADLTRIRDVVGLFDVDALRSQSFGLFPLRYSSARAVVADLAEVVGKQGPMASLVRIAPIDHLNAILVTSPRLSYVEEIKTWITRFDRGRNADVPRLFVYRVQNGRASVLAGVLNRVLGQGGGASASGDAEETALAPADARPLTTAGASALASPAPAATSTPINTTDAPPPLLGGLPVGTSASTAAGGGASPLGNIRVTADDTNNALLIVTTPDKFTTVETALQQLDVPPLQVLIEASVAEVTLTDQLQYGLQYFFQSGSFSLLASTAAAGTLATSTGGLSVALLKSSSTQVVLNLLSEITTVKVLSAPKLLVLNNRPASIQVGDQVPVATSSAVGVVTANAPIVNTIQQLDTGIILKVTPRVNQGGLVLLDFNQEVSSTVPTTSSSINSPTVQQRKLSSSVAVRDGQTIAVGGLISDNRTRDRTGVPWLDDVPVLGPLFGTTSSKTSRTELLVLITPHIVQDAQAAAAATEELRTQLPMIEAQGGGRPR